MLRDVDCHIPALCKVIRNHTYQQVTWRSASFSTQQSGEEPYKSYDPPSRVKYLHGDQD